MKGKVYLVGAGPGDIGLLTVKGLRCLKKANVVVYDFHLNAQVLHYINHNAEFIYAGKRGGHHTMTQDDIDNGRFICIIGVAPVKPAEFVIFRIAQWQGGSEVSE